MTVPSHKFSDFVDIVLVRLYEADRAESDKFVDLSMVQKEIKGDVPASWLLDVAKVLQSLGLAQCIINSNGVYAQITGQGRLYVENHRGKTGEIEKNPSIYYNVTVSGSQNLVVTGQNTGPMAQNIAGDNRQGPWSDIVDAIEKKVREDVSLDDDQRRHSLDYVQIVRGELRKREPNRTIIAAVLEPLSQIVSIASQVANLIKVFNGWG